MSNRRFFRAHPALGIQAVSDESKVQALSDEQLGSEWAHLSDEDKYREESRFFQAILRYFADLEDATFKADVPLPEDREKLRNVAAEIGRSVLAGELTVEAATLLPAANIEILLVHHKSQRVMELRDGWTGVLLIL